MAQEHDPLIVVSTAARRLRLLQLPLAAAAAGAAAPAAPPGCSLPAALLPEPAATAHSDSQDGWHAERDVLAEVAVTLRTLQALKV